MISLLTFQDLAQWLGFKRPSDVEKKLKDLGIEFYHDRENRPITTLEAINSTLIKNKEDDWQDFA
ncbi:hypothetical protein THIOSC15_560002 [uncultured Thiomicrorhabdus sp.]